MTIISESEFSRFAPYSTSVIAKAIQSKADVVFPTWGINTAPRLQMFMAMAKVESAGFSQLFEDMSYSAARLVQVWPSRFPNLAAAKPYERNPAALANKVYGGRLGNIGPNDGWLCRGQGLMQTTGLSNFARLAKALNVPVDQCRAMLTADATLLECAAATFAIWGCMPYADKGDVRACTLAINGGLNGLTDREAAYALAKQVWPTIRAPAATPPSISQQTPPVPALRGAAHIDVVAKATAPLSAWQRFKAMFGIGVPT